MRRLTVVSLAYPFAPVGPDAVGGAEQVLAAIDAALVAAGHRSIVIACDGSRVAGELRALPPLPPDIGPAERADAASAVRAALLPALAEADLLHCHGIDFADHLPPPGLPVLATLHLPPAWYPPHALMPARLDTFVHAVSATQHAACPESPALLPPIPNGVDVAGLGAARHARRGFALMLGRICPEKGQHLALRAARLADVPLLLAGAAFPYPEHVAYWHEDVQPLLDGRRRWIGPVGLARKRRLLAAARCLLVPSLAAETSSLVAMEAAACGTPVIAFRAGALPEIVRDGVTGFLVDGVTDMADAIGRASAIEPAACRAEAASRFDARRMTGAYLDRYHALVRVAA